MDNEIRPAIKAMPTMAIITLQHEVANSQDESDKQFRHELLLELGIRDRESQKNNES